jgi:Na+-transporting methylmalonyl-CoA/oxaloacetate decarboxylase gamma subunit
MWSEAIKVAIVGFSVVFAGLWILAIGVKIMSFFCKMVEKKGSGPSKAELNKAQG